MAKKLSFKQIDGVQRSPCVTTFASCMHWLCQRGLGDRFVGDLRGVGHWTSCFTRHFLIGSQLLLRPFPPCCQERRLEIRISTRRFGKKSQKRTILSQTFLYGIGSGNDGPFSNKHCLQSVLPSKVSFFCIGSQLRKSCDFRSSL